MKDDDDDELAGRSGMFVDSLRTKHLPESIDDANLDRNNYERELLSSSRLGPKTQAVNFNLKRFNSQVTSCALNDLEDSLMFGQRHRQAIV